LSFAGIHATLAHADDPGIWEMAVLGLVIGAAICVPDLWPGRYRNTIRRESLAKARAEWPFGPRHIELRPDGLFVQSSIFSGVYPWSAITRVATSPTGVYLTTTEKRSIVIPLKAFATPAAAGAFAAEARRLMEAGRPKAPPI